MSNQAITAGAAIKVNGRAAVAISVFEQVDRPLNRTYTAVRYAYIIKGRASKKQWTAPAADCAVQA